MGRRTALERSFFITFWVFFPVIQRFSMVGSQQSTENCTITVATINIRDGKNARLNAACRCLSQMNVGIGVLTETKFMNKKYTKRCEGYTIKATKAESRHCGGVALIYKKQKTWTLESVKCFGPNVIRATITMGQKRYSLIGAYIPSSETTGQTLDFINKAKMEANN